MGGKDNVINMANAGRNAMLQSSRQALEEAIIDIDNKRGAFAEGKKVLIIALDDSTGEYCISWIQAGMKMSECMALCDIAKGCFKGEMGY